MAALYPAPVVAGRPSGSSNFLVNAGTQTPTHTRIDHNFNDNSCLYGRLLVSTNTRPKFI